MQEAFQVRYSNLIEELDLGHREEITSIESLSGGVASDIVRVDLGGYQLCLKCALEKLKVKEDWRAPLHRNKAEYAWLKVAAAVNPEGAVKLMGRSEKQPCFAMEYLEGDDVYLWKTSLLNGTIRIEEARSVGQTIGKIHEASACADFLKEPFFNQDDFYQLRLDPYLNFTAACHPVVATQLKQLVSRLHKSDDVLIHGDISPKNILFRDGYPVILDAECATLGDASFDIAFCLNHLVLKAIHLPAIRSDLLNAALVLWNAYAPYIHWENPQQLEQRICELLPALMLARVDGKSPVEYLDEAEAQTVREFSLEQLQTPSQSLSNLLEAVASELENKRQ